MLTKRHAESKDSVFLFLQIVFINKRTGTLKVPVLLFYYNIDQFTRNINFFYNLFAVPVAAATFSDLLLQRAMASSSASDVRVNCQSASRIFPLTCTAISIAWESSHFALIISQASCCWFKPFHRRKAHASHTSSANMGRKRIQHNTVNALNSPLVTCQPVAVIII